ncbi:MAG: PorT family protein [Bacteroidetes bacterium]|nr:PorT family protein [Bacteroidota bacterium]
MKKHSQYILIIILVCIFGLQALPQGRVRLENLPRYDRKRLHFGFNLGINKMDFLIKPVEKLQTFDSLLEIHSKPAYGFNIGIVSNLKLAEHFDLRFIPALSFGERSLEYTYLKNDTNRITVLKKVESTFIDLPLLLKYKSARLINSRAYVITGFKYSIDMASQKGKKDLNSQEEIIKLRRNDFSYELGVGGDFYLEYFKFAVEIKMSYGLRDLLVRDNSFYTSSINKLNSKIFLISFLFE